MESWRPIPGWPYEASSLGRIRRSVGGKGTRAGHILATKPHKCGYLMVDLSRDNKVHRFQVGRLVCMAFHGEPDPPTLNALHKNGQPKDNIPVNLYWGTQRDNVADARRHDTIARGDRHGQAKLSEAIVREMRALRQAGVKLKDLAQRFGVSKSNAWEACKGRRQWAHVK